MNSLARYLVDEIDRREDDYEEMAGTMDNGDIRLVAAYANILQLRRWLLAELGK